MPQHKGANPTAFAELCLLLQKPHTRQELAQLIGVWPMTITRWMRMLRRRQLIYVSGHRRIGSSWVKLWAWGYCFPDTPQPKAQTSSQTSRAYRRRLAERKEAEELPRGH